MATLTDPKRPILLVATDFSECARAALDRALVLARALDGEVHLFHVIRFEGYPTTDLGVTVANLMRDLEEDAQRGLEELARAVDPARERVRRFEFREGLPVDLIVNEARERGASMVVMGTHGRRGLSRLLMGSVAERVVRMAPCDVLVVKGPAGASQAT